MPTPTAPEISQEDVLHLTHLLQTPGWHVITRLVEGDLALLRKELEDPETPPARDQEIKLQIGYMKELVGMPQNYIDQNSPDSESEGDDDPFENQDQLTERRKSPKSNPAA